MSKSQIVLLVLLTAVTLGITGCSHVGDDWKAAQAADTTEAYQDFLRQHPDSEFGVPAQERIKQLAEDRLPAVRRDPRRRQVGAGSAGEDRELPAHGQWFQSVRHTTRCRRAWTLAAGQHAGRTLDTGGQTGGEASGQTRRGQQGQAGGRTSGAIGRVQLQGPRRGGLEQDQRPLRRATQITPAALRRAAEVQVPAGGASAAGTGQRRARASALCLTEERVAALHTGRLIATA